MHFPKEVYLVYVDHFEVRYHHLCKWIVYYKKRSFKIIKFIISFILHSV